MSVDLVRAILRGRSDANLSNSHKRQQAPISRRRLYPLTIFYTAYAAVVLILTLRTAHPWVAVIFFLAGIPMWTLVEYVFHRFVLHGFIRRFAHQRLDPLRWEHHERPLDGMHISGELKDLLPLFGVAAPVSFLFPIYTLPVLLAAVVQGYVTRGMNSSLHTLLQRCDQEYHIAFFQAVCGVRASNQRFCTGDCRVSPKKTTFHATPQRMNGGYSKL